MPSQEVIHFLQAHNVQVKEGNERHDGYYNDYHIITFPAGTTKQRLFPVVESDHFKLTLPDNTIIYTIYNSHVNMHYDVAVYAIGMEISAFEQFLKENP